MRGFDGARGALEEDATHGGHSGAAAVAERRACAEDARRTEDVAARASIADGKHPGADAGLPGEKVGESGFDIGPRRGSPASQDRQRRGSARDRARLIQEGFVGSGEQIADLDPESFPAPGKALTDSDAMGVAPARGIDLQGSHGRDGVPAAVGRTSHGPRGRGEPGSSARSTEEFLVRYGACDGIGVVPPAPRRILGERRWRREDAKCQRDQEGEDPALRPMFAFCALAALLSGALRLSEIMVDPSSVEDVHGEYVELQARGGAVDLRGFRLALPGGDTVALPAKRLEDGAFWTLGRVFETDNGGFRPDSMHPAMKSFPNAGGAIRLLDASLVELDAHVYGRTTAGASFEACPGGDWKTSTATFGKGDRGTPGGVNSCDDAPLALEGAVIGLFRDRDTLRASIRNRGTESWVGREVSWSRDGERVRSESVDLAPGGVVGLAQPVGRILSRHRWVVRLPSDGRPTDDSMGLWVRDAAGRLVLSEIQPADDQPEWVELAQTLDVAFPIGGWSLGDGEPRGRIPPGAVVPASGRLLLSSDCASLRALVGVSTLPCAQPSPWPRLSVVEDRISLRDADGGLWDSVSWSRAGGAWPAKRTRERQDLSSLGDADRWLPSGTDGGTPGYGPEDAGGWSDASREAREFRVADRRFRIGDPARSLRMELRFPHGEEIRIDLHDMSRRKVLRIHQGPPPRGGVLVWDGRDGQGRDIKPGVYVVVLESGPARKPTWKAKEWIVAAPR